MSPRKRTDSNERSTDGIGNVVTPCLTREQAMTLVNTMQANGIVVRIHPALDDTDG